MVKTAVDLLIEYFPSFKVFLLLGVPSLIAAFVYLYLAGWLKRYRKWKTGYSRKVFHFFVFISASIVQSKLDLTGTIVFGTAVSIVVFYAIWRGQGNLLYEAMAREKDSPRQTYYIVSPYLATLFGGILANILFTTTGAAVGYLATGFGDAVGEPFGTRFGRHQYRVPSLKKVTSYRTYEGSAAVLVATIIALFIGVLLFQIPFTSLLIIQLIMIGIATSIIEGISPHGWDNFTTQLGAAGLFFLMIL